MGCLEIQTPKSRSLIPKPNPKLKHMNVIILLRAINEMQKCSLYADNVLAVFSTFRSNWRVTETIESP